jgi:GxxExxY protein
MANNYIKSELTEQIIKAFYKVYNELGSGFLEKVYENALLIELKEMGLDARAQEDINVYYKKKLVGEFCADIIVNNEVILELKAVKQINPIHEVQLVNYLKATGIQVGLLLNFGTEPDIRRRVLNYEDE